MFDLKAKLLEKGLVTKEQADKIAAEKKRESAKKASGKNTVIEDDFLLRERKRALEHLKTQVKAEQYVVIRKWVDLNRLDKARHASLDGEKFFFPSVDNQITWLTLRKDVIEAIQQGKAGVIAYMGNHGLTHAVVPKDIAEDVYLIFPDWLRVLN